MREAKREVIANSDVPLEMEVPQVRCNGGWQVCVLPYSNTVSLLQLLADVFLTSTTAPAAAAATTTGTSRACRGGGVSRWIHYAALW